MQTSAKSTSKKPKTPRVFISYTHESSTHKAWVRKLSKDLRSNGVDAILDQWECKYGSDLTLFMEKGIAKSDRVLLVCTPTYRKRAVLAKGGVGYERLVVTSEIAENIRTDKFICVLRLGTASGSIPVFAKTRLFIDFRKDTQYKLQLEELLRDVHRSPVDPKPPVGPNPFALTRVQINLPPESPGEAVTHKPPIGANPFVRRLPETRTALTHKFDIAGHEGYLTVGLFEDGHPGELFVTMAKEGSTVAGLVDTIAALTSLALQYGVPLEVLVRRFAHQRFEPSGFTKNPEIRSAASIIDYIFRWLGLQFLAGYRDTNIMPGDPSLLEEFSSINLPRRVPKSGQKED